MKEACITFYSSLHIIFSFYREENWKLFRVYYANIFYIQYSNQIYQILEFVVLYSVS